MFRAQRLHHGHDWPWPEAQKQLTAETTERQIDEARLQYVPVASARPSLLRVVFNVVFTAKSKIKLGQHAPTSCVLIVFVDCSCLIPNHLSGIFKILHGVICSVIYSILLLDLHRTASHRFGTAVLAAVRWWRFSHWKPIWWFFMFFFSVRFFLRTITIENMCE